MNNTKPYNQFNNGVVFYKVSNPHKEKYNHLANACCRRYKTTALNNKPINSIIITFNNNSDSEPISFTFDNTNFNKKNVEISLLTIFQSIQLIPKIID